MPKAFEYGGLPAQTPRRPLVVPARRRREHPGAADVTDLLHALATPGVPIAHPNARREARNSGSPTLPTWARCNVRTTYDSRPDWRRPELSLSAAPLAPAAASAAAGANEVGLVLSGDKE